MSLISRRSAIKNILKDLDKDDLVITSTGKISREAWEIYKKKDYKFGLFPMMGSMGCALPIALGVAMNTEQRVFCLVGDGATLMKLGAVATYLKYYPINLFVVVLNNNAHDSTGGQPTNFKEIKEWLSDFKIIDVEKGAKKDLIRIDLSPEELVKNFREHIHTKS